MPRQKGRRDEILQIALDEFTTVGYAGSRLQTIADQTGVTKAMIHYYFDTKENLFRETYVLVCKELMSGLFDTLDNKKTLFSKVDAFVDEVTKRFGQHPQYAAFLVNELNRHPKITRKVLQNSYESDFANLNKQLKQAASNYKIAPVSSTQLVANILSLCIFPYTANHFLKATLPNNDKNLETFFDERREVIKDTIINWLSG